MPTAPHRIFVFLSFFFLLLFACEKEPALPTVIIGKVTNIKTAAPIPGVSILCSSETGDFGKEYYVDRSTSSNNLGEYKIVIPPDYRFSIYEMYEPGYLPKIDPAGAISIQKGDTNTVNVQLIPTDGFLRLILKNDMIQYDSIYVKIFSPIAYSEGLGVTSPKNYPTVLTSNGMYDEYVALPSEENVIIYWDYKHFITPNSLFQSSVFLPPNDTTDFFISF